ncbi:Hypothetical protein, putative [Bodo saltans]|uniref:GPI-anchored surface protein n=1 Tax=Bodo saltans TaxID=75058 RepID=A0A0S4JMM5_BODSA|nr:Hypothetical protein, putative [Bodo saltans]|eukprot:CUG91160.1 Hypothetical protein, putative [Bodo saltans]
MLRLDLWIYLLLASLSADFVVSQNIITCDTSALTLSSAGTYTLTGCSAPAKIVTIDATVNSVTLSVVSSTIQSIQISSGGSVAVVLSSSTLTSSSTSNIVVSSLPTSMSISMTSSTLTTTSLANVYVTPAVPASVVNIVLVSSTLAASGGNNLYFGGAISGIGLSISGGAWSSSGHCIYFASSFTGSPSPIAVTMRSALTMTSSSASALYFGGAVSNVGLSFLDSSTTIQSSSNTIQFASSATVLRMTMTSCTITSAGASNVAFQGASSSITISTTSASLIASTSHNLMFVSGVTVTSLSLSIASASLLRSGTSGTSSANIAISGSSSNLIVTITGSSVLSCQGVGQGNIYVAGNNNAATVSVVSSTLSSSGYNFNLGTVTALGVYLNTLTGVTSGTQSFLLAATSGIANTIAATTTASWTAGGGYLLVQGATTQLLLTIDTVTIAGSSGHLVQFGSTVSSFVGSITGSSLTATAGAVFQFSGVMQSSC